KIYQRRSVPDMKPWHALPLLLRSFSATPQPAGSQCMLQTKSMQASDACLSFIHIPKTGGTTVEDCKREAVGGLEELGEIGDWNTCASLRGKDPVTRLWGMCDDQLLCSDPLGSLECSSLSTEPVRLKPSQEQSPLCSVVSTSCSRWHLPPALDEQLKASYHAGACHTFCVVREPLSRLKSEWLYRQDIGELADACSSEALDVFIETALAKARSDMLAWDCHLMPQARPPLVYYVFAAGDRRRERICEHVLKLETLEEDFDGLMQGYGLSLRLGETRRDGRNCSAEPSKKMRQLVQDFYSEDYIAFGYPFTDI
ncbi:unnamed protein product, partial [Effrenium voratum]